MKEIATYGDQYGKWYEVKDSDGYHKAFRRYQDATEYYKELYGKYYYAIDTYEESEEDRAAIEPFAGMQLTTGEQARAYADHYIGAHVKGIAAGKTYSEVSGEALAANAASKADPNNTELAAKAAGLMGQRTTLFMGETLKGLLGNAYAFWQLGQIAMYAMWAALAGGVIMLILSILGFMHLRRTPEGETV